MQVQILFLLLAILGAVLRIFVGRKPRTAQRVLESFLMFGLASLVGLGGIWAFMGHAFMPDRIAAYIGWAPGSPFQFEVAVANLAIGVLGILCLFFGRELRLATIVAYTVFLWGSAAGHLMDAARNGNRAPGNTGAPLAIDIALPLVLIALSVASRLSQRRS